MDTSIVEITSRKRKRNEEMEEVLEETTFVVVSLVTMLLGVMSWYYDKYFVKEPVRNWELERRIFLNRLYRGTEADYIQQLRVSKGEAIEGKLHKVTEDLNELIAQRQTLIISRHTITASHYGGAGGAGGCGQQLLL
ncbi:hypothetical protein QL285_022250 [Trifolium repens]|nr:hypothetical protein QL285_022250 [Trifolium repens]